MKSCGNCILFFCFSQYDAILFHQRSLSKTDLPQKRKAQQKYIMYMLESASYPFGFVRYVHYEKNYMIYDLTAFITK